MTVQDVLDIALTHMDEVDENGNYTDDEAYKKKAPVILNVLQRQIAKLEGLEPSNITALTDDLVVSDAASSVALPYGLAARLCLADGLQDFFLFYQSLYDKEVKQLGVKQEDMVDVQNVMKGF